VALSITMSCVLGAIFNRFRGGWLLRRYHDLTNALATAFNTLLTKVTAHETAINALKGAGAA